jgi:hypothetical protein
MKIRAKVGRVLALAATAWAGVSRLTPARADTAVNWSAAINGNWTDATKWSSNPNYPNNNTPTGTNYTATIAAGSAAYTVSIAQNITVDGLTLNSASATVQQTAGVLDVNGTLDLKAGSYQLVVGTLQNARVQSEGGTFSLGGQGFVPVLDGITLATPLTIEQPAPAFMQDGLTLDHTTITLNGQTSGGFSSGAHLYASGDMTLGGTGTVVFANGDDSLGDFSGLSTGTFTIGPNITLQASSGEGYLGGNSGSSGAGNNLVNQGTINISGTGLITLSGAWNNLGTINQSGGTLVLGGTFNTSSLGNFVHTAGQVQLAGVLTNTGHTLNLSATTGSLYSNGGTIIGGTISSGGTSTFAFGNGATWTGVSLGSDLTVPNADTGALTATSGLNLGGHTLTLAPLNQINLSGNLSNGTIVVAPPLPNTSNVASTISGDSFTIGSDATIKTGGSNVAVNVTGTNWTNKGTLLANNPGSPLNISGNWVNLGTIGISNNDTAYLGGTFTTAAIGSIYRADGASDTVVINGTLNNSGTTLNLNNTGPLLLQTAVINGGTISSTVGADLNVSGGGIDTTLNGVTLGVNVTVADSQTLYVNGITLNNSSITLRSSAASGATLGFTSTQTLTGNGSIILDGPGVYTKAVTYTGDTVTIGPNILLTTTPGGAGNFGSAQFIFQGIVQPAAGGSVTLTSELMSGTVNISAGTTVTLNNLNNSGTITNNGTLGLGGTIYLSQLGNLTNKGQISIVGYLDNTGHTFTTDPTQLPWDLNNAGEINGGTIASPLNVATGTGELSNVTLSSTVTVKPSALLLILPALNLSNGAIDLQGAAAGAAATRLGFNSDTSITGTGTIELDNTNTTTVSSVGALTLGPNIHLLAVSGGATFLPVSTNSFTNNGTINANSSAATLAFSTYAMTNHGTISATAGATIDINSSGWVNTGSISATSSTLGLTGPWTNTGSIQVSNGTVNFSGSVTPALLAQIQLSGTDSFNILGSIINSGNTLDPTLLGATLEINGGLVAGGTLSHTVTAIAATFSGVAFSATANVLASTSLVIAGNSSNAGLITATNMPVTIGQSGSPAYTFLNTGTLQDPGGSLTVFDVFNTSTPISVVSLANSGTVILSNTTGQFGPITGNGSLIVSSGSSLSANSVVQSTFNISGTAVVAPRGAGNSSASTLSVLSNLTLGANGLLDLNNNDLQIHSANAAATLAELIQGYASGNWNGTTGIRSTPAAGSTLFTLGYVYNASATKTRLINSFDGVNTVLNDALIKYTYYGDTNLDGKVDGTDYSRIDAAYLADKTKFNASTGWFNGDFNYDGVIDGSDYTLIDNAFNAQGAQLSAEIASPTAQFSNAAPPSVPEPPAASLLLITITGLLGRRPFPKPKSHLSSAFAQLECPV